MPCSAVRSTSSAWPEWQWSASRVPSEKARSGALRPIIGAEKIVRFIAGGSGKILGTLTADLTVVNGNPALVLRLDGELDGVMAIRVEDAHISGVYYVRNPEKLTRLESATALALR